MVPDLPNDPLRLIVNVALVDAEVARASARLDDRQRDERARCEDREAGDEVAPAAA